MEAHLENTRAYLQHCRVWGQSWLAVPRQGGQPTKSLNFIKCSYFFSVTFLFIYLANGCSGSDMQCKIEGL